MFIFRNMKISLGKYLLMLIAPLIAALIVSVSFSLSIEQNTVLTDQHTASLNAYIDWDDSIFIIAKSNEVSSTFSIILSPKSSYHTHYILNFHIQPIK